MEDASQLEIDRKNKDFWNELCGSVLAKSLGIENSDIQSLKKYDNYYMDYYPYLKKYLPIEEFKDKDILEIGLGFGTVGQYLALVSGSYSALDISPNAVMMLKQRLEQNHLTGDVRLGSMITCPFDRDSFDFVVSIGCFHHTGNMQACVDETYRVLKKGGKAVIMVYNKFSFRQWKMWPLLTLKNYIYDLLGVKSADVIEQQRLAYDASLSGKGAPETMFYSKKQIKAMFAKYASIKITGENIDENFQVGVSRFFRYSFGDRLSLLDSSWMGLGGLDFYIEVTK
jgi:SAM-dependent methyltransferase